MGFITQRIGEKQPVAEIIEEAYHDRLKAMPGMTIRESSESKPERELDRARDD
jgi:DNA-directed RNA polymerase II subunit RPB1